MKVQGIIYNKNNETKTKDRLYFLKNISKNLLKFGRSEIAPTKRNGEYPKSLARL